jgi:hypothetical protein
MRKAVLFAAVLATLLLCLSAFAEEQKAASRRGANHAPIYWTEGQTPGAPGHDDEEQAQLRNRFGEVGFGESEHFLERS